MFKSWFSGLELSFFNEDLSFRIFCEYWFPEQENGPDPGPVGG